MHRFDTTQLSFLLIWPTKMFVIKVCNAFAVGFRFTTAAKKFMPFTFDTIVYPSDILFALDNLSYEWKVKGKGGWKMTMSLGIFAQRLLCVVGIWYGYENGLCNLRLT